MRDNYIKLIDFVFGKYMYTVMKNNDNVLYFEVVDNKYVQPISSFNLYDNEGRSLTNVNQHFFMNQLVNRINVACKKGIFISDQEIVEYLSRVKDSCNDSELKKLFKGTYMNEINVTNFENNKRSILKYLDNFKYDTFVDYNNVSVFNGSLEKNPVESNNDLKKQTELNIVVEPKEEVDDIFQSGELSNEMDVIDVVDESKQKIDVPVLPVQPESVELDFTNIPVDESKGDVVSSNDYFSNVQLDNKQSNDVEIIDDNLNNGVISPVGIVNQVNSVANPEVVLSVDMNNQVNSVVNPEVVPSVDMNNQVNSVVNPEVVPSVDMNNQVNSVVNPEVVPPVDMNNQVNSVVNGSVSSQIGTAPADFNLLYGNSNNQQINNLVQNSKDSQVIQPILNNDASINTQNNSFSNDGFSMTEPLIENSTVSNLNNNNVMYSEQIGATNYISEVKDRIESNAFNTELDVMNPNVTEMDLEKTVVTDKVNMPQLDEVTDQKGKKNKGKKSFGVIIFIIILLLVLAGFAYFLYNYIF